MQLLRQVHRVLTTVGQFLLALPEQLLQTVQLQPVALALLNEQLMPLSVSLSSISRSEKNGYTYIGALEFFALEFQTHAVHVGERFIAYNARVRYFAHQVVFQLTQSINTNRDGICI